jgi:hypothetical protein
VDTRAGLDSVEKRKFLSLRGLKLHGASFKLKLKSTASSSSSSYQMEAALDLRLFPLYNHPANSHPVWKEEIVFE